MLLASRSAPGSTGGEQGVFPHGRGYSPMAEGFPSAAGLGSAQFVRAAKGPSAQSSAGL